MVGRNTKMAKTRTRLLQAAESLFIEHGYESMSLRQITRLASANLAAVNYYFGSKELLFEEMLSKRLDLLNQERLRLLASCEERGIPLDVNVLLSVLFVPALRLNRDAGEPTLMRLLGRVYSDPAPFIRNYLQQHHRPGSWRIFEAFAGALPQLPRNELGMRLHIALKSVASLLTDESVDDLLTSLSLGEPMSDAMLLARTVALVGPMLTGTFGSPEQVRTAAQILELDAARPANTEPLLVPKQAAIRHHPHAAPGQAKKQLSPDP